MTEFVFGYYYVPIGEWGGEGGWGGAQLYLCKLIHLLYSSIIIIIIIMPLVSETFIGILWRAEDGWKMKHKLHFLKNNYNHAQTCQNLITLSLISTHSPAAAQIDWIPVCGSRPGIKLYIIIWLFVLN